MPHVFDIAPTSRAKCRGCEQNIDKDTPRFGERQPNAFGDGEMTLWFHPLCAAYSRPAPVLETLAEQDVDDAARLAAAAQPGIAHRRLPRLRSAERASSGRARCRSCRELIGKDSWRLRLVFVDDYPFQPAGFIHAACAREYFDDGDCLPRLHHFSPALDDADWQSIEADLRSAPPAAIK